MGEEAVKDDRCKQQIFPAGVDGDQELEWRLNTWHTLGGECGSKMNANDGLCLLDVEFITIS